MHFVENVVQHGWIIADVDDGVISVVCTPQWMLDPAGLGAVM